MSRASEAARKAYPDTYTRYRKEGDPEGVESGISPFPNTHNLERKCYQQGYEQAEKDIISLIEYRIGEILGDAQPAPVLRAELRELINKIKEQ